MPAVGAQRILCLTGQESSIPRTRLARRDTAAVAAARSSDRPGHFIETRFRVGCPTLLFALLTRVLAAAMDNLAEDLVPVWSVRITLVRR
jgi:hypothetical protein